MRSVGSLLLAGLLFEHRALFVALIGLILVGLVLFLEHRALFVALVGLVLVGLAERGGGGGLRALAQALVRPGAPAAVGVLRVVLEAVALEVAALGVVADAVLAVIGDGAVAQAEGGGGGRALAGRADR